MIEIKITYKFSDEKKNKFMDTVESLGIPQATRNEKGCLKYDFEVSADKYEAMKKALVNAFSSVSSSGMTTVIGLLMLVFMSFTIGKDLGLVLSKGVLFSMLCVFTVLPVLILIFDKAVTKTTKKELHH